MDMINLGQSDISVSRLAYGCMRIVGDGTDESRSRGKAAVHAAYDAGYTHFDHADIYGGGRCEELFGEVLRETPGLRESVVITSKCGIRSDPKRYDFTRDHIVSSVDGSLARLGIKRLDILLLHRPDYLFSGQEVARAFRELADSGKVAHFGVSNFGPSQVSLLQHYCDFPLITNQVEINIHNISTLNDGTLDQCQELGITPGAWCPMGGVAYPAWGNTFSDDDEQRIDAELSRQAAHYETSKELVFLAWLLEHPAVIVPIIGSTTPQRIRAAVEALSVDYSREDWYRLLEARNGHPVP